MLSSYELCTGVKNEIAKRSSAVWKNKALNTSLNKHNLYFGLIFAIFLLKMNKNEITKKALYEYEKIRLLKLLTKSTC